MWGWPAPLPDAPGAPVAVEAPPWPDRSGTPELAERWHAGEVSTLGELIDVALSRNPETRIAYLQVRGAAADLAASRAAYVPTLELDGVLSTGRQAAQSGATSVRQTVYGPSLTLNYLLFDFGGRGGRNDEAYEALAAAALSHNAAILDVVLQVQQAYYGLQTAKAAAAAAEATLKETAQGLSAAEGRRDSGVATLAEVLQARTARSQALLELQRLQGQEQGLVGVLATVLGLPANTLIDVGSLPESLPVVEAAGKVESSIEQALAARPDLAAARAQALRAQAHIGTVRSGAFPTLGLVGNASRQYYQPHPYELYSDNWSVQLALRIPLFDGLASVFAARRAAADAEVAVARADSIEQQVILQVWLSFHDLETALLRLTTARDLLLSAEQSERVALGRYQEGAGSILDLLTAQAALANARAQEIMARSDWLLAVAQLAHSTGSLEPQAPRAAAYSTLRKEDDAVSAQP